MNRNTSMHLFSEYFDGRLQGPALGRLMKEIESSPELQREWERYQRLFAWVASREELQTKHPFKRPPDFPGGAGRSAPPLAGAASWRRRAAWAASLLVVSLLGFSVFELGRGDFGPSGKVPAALPPGAALVRGAVPVSQQQEIRENWRDHLDLTNVTLHQLSLTDRNSAREANAMLKAKLALLKPAPLRAARADYGALGSAAAFAPVYIRSMEHLTHLLAEHVGRHATVSPAALLRRHQQELNQLQYAMQRIWGVVGREACGRTWNRQQERLRSLTQIPKGEVRAVLSAEVPFLSADYPRANRSFAAFLKEHPRSCLGPVARFMQSWALWRLGRLGEASALAHQSPLIPRVHIDLPAPAFLIQRPGFFLPDEGFLTLRTQDVIRMLFHLRRPMGSGGSPWLLRVEIRKKPASKRLRKL